MLMTLVQVKTALGITTTTYDAFLTQRIAVVSDAIEFYCQRKFNMAKYKETRYLDDKRLGKRIMLYHYPVKDIESADIDSSAIEDIRLDHPTGIISRGHGFYFYGDKIEIVYNAGYDTLPPIIQAVLLGIVEGDYNKKVAGVDLNFGSDVQRISIPGTISIDYDYSLTNNEEDSLLGGILGNYRNMLTPYLSDRSIIGSGEVTYVASAV